MTERFNQTLITHLTKVVDDNQRNWDERVQSILFAYRVNRQASTKMSPFEIMYGMKARLPVDLVFEDTSPSTDGDEEQLLLRVSNFADGLVMMREKEKANDNIKEAQAKQKKRFDMKHAPAMYEVGNKVFKYNRRHETRMGDKLRSEEHTSELQSRP